MPRPVKPRQVIQAPGATYFKPVGVPMRSLEGVTLNLEEVEAIRLKDIEDLHQEECAGSMGVSRATFHQVLKSARQKLADAVLNGKSIRVEGGHYAFRGGRFRCRRDGREWMLPAGPLPRAELFSCPTCRGRDIEAVTSGEFPGRRARCGHGHGRHGGGRGMGRGFGGSVGSDAPTGEHEE